MSVPSGVLVADPRNGGELTPGHERSWFPARRVRRCNASFCLCSLPIAVNSNPPRARRCGSSHPYSGQGHGKH